MRADVQDNRAAFEQHLAVLLENRHLAERLQRAIVGFVLIALPQQASPIGKPRFLERPAYAQIADLALSERRDPAKGGNGDPGVFSLVVAAGGGRRRGRTRRFVLIST